MLPGVFGGPLSWADPGLWATPSTALIAASCAAVVAAVVWTSRNRRGCGVIWWLVGAYLAINAAAMIMGRLNEATPALLSLSLRYYADTPLILAVAMALVIIAPVREDLRPNPVLTLQGRRTVAVGAAVVYLVASVWSTATFMRIWTDSPTEEYLTTAKATLEKGHAPLLDQGVPNTVLWALVHPYNLASHVFAPLGDTAEFVRSTPELQMLDESGQLIGAHLDTLRSLQDGPLENCGHGVSGTRTSVIPIDGPLVPLEWTVQLNYVAGADGTLRSPWTDRRSTCR